jgi:hypothetical protein
VLVQRILGAGDGGAEPAPAAPMAHHPGANAAGGLRGGARGHPSRA